MKYWVTAADKQSKVIFNQLVEANTVELAMAAAKQAVPAELHGSICVTDENGDPIKQASHTPTPWHVVDGTKIKDELMPFDRDERDCKLIAIACSGASSQFMTSDEEAVANAALIVLAVNSHDQLVAALRKAVQVAEIASDWALDEVQIDGEMVDVLDLREEFTAALAAAGA